MKSIITFLALVFSFSLFAGNGKLSSVSIMTYNVENLFDTIHDKGKEDYTYLPKVIKDNSAEIQAYCKSLSKEHYKKSCLETDWTKDKLETKIKNIAKVIMTAQSGYGADILVFQEVENLNVLTMLVNKELSKFGYNYVTLLEGQDSRGIDIGMVSRFPVLSQKVHHLNLAPHSTRTTRPILEVTYAVAGKTVTVFGNHWPSQGNIDETRIVASEKLADIAKKSKSDLVIATGDFNTVKDDVINGIKENILPIFEDVEVKGRLFNNVEAKGTHWYKGEWDSLDKIFVLKRCLSKGKVSVNYKTFNIIKENFMVRDITWTNWDDNSTHQAYGVPHRSSTRHGGGYSDHLPVFVEIDL